MNIGICVYTNLVLSSALEGHRLIPLTWSKPFCICSFHVGCFILASDLRTSACITAASDYLSVVCYFHSLSLALSNYIFNGNHTCTVRHTQSQDTWLRFIILSFPSHKAAQTWLRLSLCVDLGFHFSCNICGDRKMKTV